MKKYSIVTVNYNSSASTIKMLESLNEAHQYIQSVVIVDNKSRDDDYNALMKYVRRERKICTSVVKSKKNIGYFPGLNLGIKTLELKSDKYIVICNNDIQFCHGFFDKLEEASFGPTIMAICPSVKTVDGLYQNPSLARKPSSFRKFFYKIYYSNYYLGKALLWTWRTLGFGKTSFTTKDDVSKEIFLGIGAVYILTPKFFRVYSELMYPSFLYSEELFLSKQIRDAGGIKWYYPEIEVVHAESVSTSTLSNKKRYALTKESYNLCKAYYD